MDTDHVATAERLLLGVMDAHQPEGLSPLEIAAMAQVHASLAIAAEQKRKNDRLARQEAEVVARARRRLGAP